MHSDLLALHRHVGAAEVLEGGDGGEAGSVDEPAIGGENVYVGADGEAGGAGENAEGFGVEGVRASDGFLEEAGEQGFSLILAGRKGG